MTYHVNIMPAKRFIAGGIDMDTNGAGYAAKGMKRFVTVILAVAMVSVLFSGCKGAEPPPPATPAPAPTPAEATVKPTEAPTPAPTPTELTEEEKQRLAYLEEYEELKGYCEQYGDEYAAFLIKKMADDGKIPRDLLYNVDSYLVLSDDEETWGFIGDFCGRWVGVLNGTNETLYPSLVDDLMGELQNAAWEGKTYISVFDTEEKRERVKKGIDIINQWCENPTDENRIRMEHMFFSEELTPGEIMMLDLWAWSNPKPSKQIPVNGKN
jgi:hypothetical protein